MKTTDVPGVRVSRRAGYNNELPVVEWRPHRVVHRPFVTPDRTKGLCVDHRTPKKGSYLIGVIAVRPKSYK